VLHAVRPLTIFAFDSFTESLCHDIIGNGEEDEEERSSEGIIE